MNGSMDGYPEPARFTERQRRAMIDLAGDRCEQCGTALLWKKAPGQKHFNGDHVIPRAHGGDRTAGNRQSLCNQCNQQKGACVATLPWPWPANKPLRPWQQNLLTKFRTHRTDHPTSRDFLAEATPGAGKSLGALRLAVDLLNQGVGKRLIIVVPSRLLRDQWIEICKETLGMEITKDPRQLRTDPHYHGLVVTYHRVASDPQALQMLAAQFQAIVILDEIHHAGDDLTWERNLREAFHEHAGYRIMTTGTPFRSDARRIPWVEYVRDENHPTIDVCESHFRYGYGDAVDDGVARPIHFVGLNLVEERRQIDETVLTVRLDDPIPSAAQKALLEQALNPTGPWIKTAVTAANECLVELRDAGHKTAQGLIVAIDQTHARRIAEVVGRITKQDPVLVISEDPRAAELLAMFRDKPKEHRWLVAVQMLSEGVDIPNLRVMVYASNITRPLTVFQRFGRVARILTQLVEKPLRRSPSQFKQWAYIWLPEYTPLMRRALEIREQILHHVGMVPTEAVPAGAVGEEAASVAGEGTDSPLPGPDSSPQEAVPEPGSEVVNGVQFDPVSLAWAAAQVDRLGSTVSPIDYLFIVRDLHVEPAPTETTEPESAFSQWPRERQREELRRQCDHRAKRLARLQGVEVKVIHQTWRMKGKKAQAEATVEELDQKLDWLAREVRCAQAD